MITTDKVTEIFWVLDEFCKNVDAELTKNLHKGISKERRKVIIQDFLKAHSPCR